MTKSNLRVSVGDIKIQPEELNSLNGLFGELSSRVEKIARMIAQQSHNEERCPQVCTFTISYAAPFLTNELATTNGDHSHTSLKVHIRYTDGTSECLEDPPGINYAC